jgi:diguanylate cyclase (GGDEF)-like protein
LFEILAQHANLAIMNASLHSEMEHMVITDNLTGLYNRKYLDDHMTLSLTRDHHGTLLVIDIDHFKQINDTYGHQSGDNVLRQVARIIRENVRESDIAARWGGEEFAVYLPHVELNQGVQIAERIRKNVELKTNPKVTISCGISYWDRSKDGKVTVESVFAIADEVLYEAKKAGRNKWMVAQKLS